MREYLEAFNLLTSTEIDVLESHVTHKTLKKGDFFIREGQVCREVAFVASGLLRSYYHTSDSEEATYCFTFSNTFVSAYSSFLQQVPTAENIQALSDVTLFSVARTAILELENSSTNWLRFSKLLAEQEYVNLEKRIFLLQKESAEKRYLDLLTNHPQYLQEIPLNYLASYLGITQRHLSRIRKSVTH